MFSKHRLYAEDIESILKSGTNWNLLFNNSICVVGATGMIGTMLVDVLMMLNRLYSADIKLWIVVRNECLARLRFSSYIDKPHFHIVSGDINKGMNLNVSFDYLFHCASNTHPHAYSGDPIGTVMTNIIGTYNILEYANRTKTKRVMFLSSVEIYGENRGDTKRFSETYCGYIDCNTLRAGYPEGKRAGEALCQAYISSYDMDIVIPRLSRVYGPTMRWSDSKALSQFIKKSVSGDDIVLKSDGMQLFSYCYVADVVSALFCILLKGLEGEAYNVADVNSEIRLKDAAMLLAAQEGRTVRFELPDKTEAQGYSKVTTALLNTDKLLTLGWQPQYNMEAGLKRTVCILREERERLGYVGYN